MNFDFDDTQYALRDLARDLFTRQSPPLRVRGVLEGKPLESNVWAKMAEAGITGITVPESYGGAGGTALDMTLVYEEAGRTALPEPLLAVVGIAAPLVATYGDDIVKGRLLPKIASGEAQPDVSFDGVDVVVDGQRLPGAALDAHALAFAGTASLLNGVAMQLCDMTVAYVKDRHQFGKPVGSFQAVKHKLASMHTAISLSRPAAWYAAYAVTNKLTDATIAAAVAKIAANDSEELCNAGALQCHGGIGFTWEHDLHLWLKRGMELRATYGSSQQLRRNFAAVHTLEELLA